MKTKLLKKIRNKFHVLRRKERINTISVKKEINYKDFANVNDLFEVSKSEVVTMWTFIKKRNSLYKKSQSLRECIIWAKDNL